MNIRKRGQLDKSIGALPIFFLVVVIVALFVMLNVGVFSAKKSSDRTSSDVALNMPILFDIISLEMNGNIERMSVLEAFNKSKGKGVETWMQFENTVLELTPQNGCIAFLWIDLGSSRASIDGSLYVDPLTNPNGFFGRNVNGNTEKIDYNYKGSPGLKKLYDLYKDKGYLESVDITFSVDNTKYKFMTYKGACLNEQ